MIMVFGLGCLEGGKGTGARSYFKHFAQEIVKVTYSDRQAFRVASVSLLPIRRPNCRPWQ